MSTNKGLITHAFAYAMARACKTTEKLCFHVFKVERVLFLASRWVAIIVLNILSMSQLYGWDFRTDSVEGLAKFIKKT